MWVSDQPATIPREPAPAAGPGAEPWGLGRVRAQPAQVSGARVGPRLSSRCSRKDMLAAPECAVLLERTRNLDGKTDSVLSTDDEDVTK